MDYCLFIITGISGSGKTTALRAFEDLGYRCVSNLPLALFDSYVEHLVEDFTALKQQITGNQQASELAKGSDFDLGFGSKDPGKSSSQAVSVDSRAENSFQLLKDGIVKLKQGGIAVEMLFFDCQDEIVVQRFKETRRPHPLLLTGTFLQNIAEALAAERAQLANFRAAANRIIDTSSHSPHDLRRLIENLCGHQRELEISLTSFGFKYGSPYDADLLVDVRFLPNPYFVAELKEKTGVDCAVQEFIFSHPEANEFVSRYLELLTFLVPHYKTEGKRYLTIGIGCTGGKHRSVAIALKLQQGLAETGIKASVRHRDSTV